MSILPYFAPLCQSHSTRFCYNDYFFQIITQKAAFCYAFLRQKVCIFGQDDRSASRRGARFLFFKEEDSVECKKKFTFTPLIFSSSCDIILRR